MIYRLFGDPQNGLLGIVLGIIYAEAIFYITPLWAFLPLLGACRLT